MLTTIVKYNTSEARELRAIFEKQLKELYWAEKSMIAILANIVSNAFSKDLIAVLTAHALDTVEQITRLEKIFTAIGIEAEAQSYEALQCFINEGEMLVSHTREGVVRDAGIISILQKMKHYEIACYGTMRAFAIALREEEVVVLLEETLEEEKQTDILLTRIAESHINIEAADKEI